MKRPIFEEPGTWFKVYPRDSDFEPWAGWLRQSKSLSWGRHRDWDLFETFLIVDEDGEEWEIEDFRLEKISALEALALQAP